MRVLLLLLALAAPALAGDLPDAALTPGLANPALTKDVLCAPGFTTPDWIGMYHVWIEK
jgi:hypothetical protein